MVALQKVRRNVTGFTIALVVGAVAGTVIQTQFNLLALQQLGVTIGPQARWTATLHDLQHFSPVYALLFGASFMLSQPVAALLLARLPVGGGSMVFALAAAVGLWVALITANWLLPMPTLIAATRSTAGLVAMLLSAAAAGWLFARLTNSRGRLAGGGMSTVALLMGLLAAMTTLLPDRAVASSHISVETVASGLEHPWSLAFLPDGGALVTERPGRLRRITAEGRLLETAVQGVPAVLNAGQAGLFDVLLSPGFAEDRRIYLAYACGTLDANHLCVARGLLREDRLEQVTEIFRAHPAKSGSAHYGGRMAWLPDGTLIVTLGDGFDYREQAQNLASHLGKIVRLNPDGSPPADNPFVGRPGALPEIYSYGHRNVQGLYYDTREDLLIAHEHGPRGGDEINIIEPGRNYGWPVISYGIDYTGAMITPFTERQGMVQPLLHWTPSIAPSGLTRYYGALFPQWQGNLLVGALADRNLHRVRLEGGRARDLGMLLDDRNARIRDVVTGPDGAIYLLTDSVDGKLLRLAPPEAGRGEPSDITLSLAPGQLDWIGQQIFRNECAERRACLVHWNEGEAFPSLGIGHFIWYPKGVDGRFVESFPSLIRYMRDRGVALPGWLSALAPFDAPWEDRRSFLAVADSEQVRDLRAFLLETRGVQAEFIFRRARSALDRVVAAAAEQHRPAITRHLEALSQTPGGIYALVDYVNFKGEGLSPTEQYRGKGWGLLQVLLEMSSHPGGNPDASVLEQFRTAATEVLTRRADNARDPIEKERWLPGWLRRVDSYREPASADG